MVWALISPSLPHTPSVSCAAEQIEIQWDTTCVSKPEHAQLSPNDTLLAIFDGIKRRREFLGQRCSSHNIQQWDICGFHGQVDGLHYVGARNLAFLNVPPVPRAPLTFASSPANQAEEKASILARNTLLTNMTHSLKNVSRNINGSTVDSATFSPKFWTDTESSLLAAVYLKTIAYRDAYRK